ncbi:MAG: DUF2344 domain-containing protein [Clostridia bacterium]|nr:DUF2344 domain-containing protein [Clostridia bacterium]
MVQLTPNKPYLTMRLKFKKVGSLQYISHLDLVRTMHKIIVRAGLPLWYTEGFNPKPKMVFAAPLSIGTESVCEFMDIRLVDDISPSEVKERLNRNMTDEMQVLDAYYTDEKLTALKWLDYSIEIKTEGVTYELAAECEKLLRSGRVVVKKKGKPHDEPRTADIAPLIKEAKAHISDGLLCIGCTLSADASSFLNPEYVISALREGCGILSAPDITKEYYSIMRLVARRADMSDFGEH